MESAVEIGIGLGSVVVITKSLCCVTIELVQPLNLGPIRLRVSVNRIAIECIGNRFVLANDLLQMRRCNVVMVVVRSTTVATEFIQFTCKQSICPAIVFDRIKDRDTIGRQGDGTTKKMRFGRQRILCHYGLQWNSPCIVIKVRLRHRDLLLPSCNTHHHPMVRHRIGFDIKVLRILSKLDCAQFGEWVKRVCDDGFASSLGRHEHERRPRLLVEFANLNCLLFDPFLVQCC